MQKERVTEDVYVFTSDLYAQVTASVIVTRRGAVLIDTLPFPQETLQIKQFVQDRLNTEVAWIINTHFHADHTNGSCFFPGAQIISHQLCRKLLDERGRISLDELKATSPEMRGVHLVLPGLVFEKSLSLYFEDKTLHLWHTPGHSPDSIVCKVEEDNILFAADTLMSLPYFVDGSYDDFLSSLESMRGLNVDAIVQGHGEVILRGEVEEKIEEDIDYLVKLRSTVKKMLEKGVSPQSVNIDLETCGKSRILLNGAVVELHNNNVSALVANLTGIMEMQFQDGDISVAE